LSRLGSLASSLSRQIGRAPTLLRTLRWLRPAQARAQLHHSLFGLRAPTRLSTPPPVQAIATGSTAFLPPAAHVRATGSDRIELLATPYQLGLRPDWGSLEFGPLFAYHLHQHEYLRTPSFGPAQRVACMLDWVEQHGSGIGWDPHPISQRLLCWGKMLMTPGTLILEESERRRILASMADQAETLARGLELRLQANHLLSNLIAVVWAGMLLEGELSSSWRGLASLLETEVDAQIHPDGGHEERSPMYQALILESLLDLLNLCRADRARAPAGLVDLVAHAAARMVTALRVLTHPDGHIALFADSGFDIAAEPAALSDYATRLGVELSEPAPEADSSAVLPQSGYIRLAARDALILASTSGPAPVHQPGHAHCDALAFELSLGGVRVVTDTGLFEYRPGPRRDRARGTASHSTLQVDAEEQAEIWAAHRVGGRPVVALLGWDGAGMAEASCSGWSRPRTLHRRSFRVEPGVATIVDQLEGPCRSVRLCLPIDPGWQIELDATSHRAWATPRDGVDASSKRFEIELPAALRWHREQGPYYPSFGREVERDVLVGEAAGLDRALTRIFLC